jgi:tryptophan synthase alpha chain
VRRIEERFKYLRKKRKKAFIVYVPFGFPQIKYTKDIILTLQECGVDIIELGIPFSDPLADGPIIQEASTIALRAGADTQKLFTTLEAMRSLLKIPLVIMTYCNPLLQFGVERFFKKMQQLDISGIIVVDLPLEESKDYIEKSRKFDLETIFFITPTTSFIRAERIVKVCRGFIYYISVTGITGPKHLFLSPLISHIRELRKITDLPICVGFGIHTRDQVERIGKFSNGVIVGSGVVKFIGENFQRPDFLKKLKAYLLSLQTS